MLCLLLIAVSHAATFFVAPDGSDGRDGSTATPWATIGHALDAAEGGDEIVVRDGTYVGQSVLSEGFSSVVTVRAEHPYHVVLTNPGGEVLRVYVEGSANLVWAGFVMTNSEGYDCSGGRESYYLVHVQDASDVTFEDDVFFGVDSPGECNEMLKINRLLDTAYPRRIVIAGCLFYDGANADGADLIDAVRPGEIEIKDSVFVGDPAHTSSQSFVTLKRQAPDQSDTASPRYLIHRNVFLHWGGKTDQAFIQLGEDGVADPEITDALIENNLFIGDSDASIAAPMQFKGARGVVVRANTVVGDLPGGSFGFRIGTEGKNPTVSGIEIRNNVFSDPTGTMGSRLVNVYGDVDTSTFALDHNLFWNAGEDLPSDGDPAPGDDRAALEADPLLTFASESTLPAWEPKSFAFADGSATIREAFLSLVEQYGALGEGSPAIDSADATNMPADDIRGLVRDAAPDRGAYESGASEGGTGGSSDGAGDSGVGADSGGGGGAGVDDRSDSDTAEVSDPAQTPAPGCACGTAAGRPSGSLISLVLLAVSQARRRQPAVGSVPTGATSKAASSLGPANSDRLLELGLADASPGAAPSFEWASPFQSAPADASAAAPMARRREEPDQDARRRLAVQIGKAREQLSDPAACATPLPVSYCKEGHDAGIDVVVFRLDGHGGMSRFVDGDGRIYRDFADWEQHNALPPGQVIYPMGGRAGARPTSENTPAVKDTFWEKATGVSDGVAFAGGLALAGAAILGTGGLALPIAAAALSAYQIARTSYSLLDMQSHGEDFSLANPSARSSYIALGAEALGFAASGAAALAPRLASVGTAGLRGASWTGGLGAASQAADAVAITDQGAGLARHWDELSPGDRFGSALEVALCGGAAGVQAHLGGAGSRPTGRQWIAEGEAGHFGPVRRGPLPDALANTFRGGSYTQHSLLEPTVLYRAHGGTSGPLGHFWTRMPPQGALQARLDLALVPEWGNTASEVTTIRVPRGTTLYEGAVESQCALVGGGNQVVLPRVDPSWVLAPAETF